MEDKSINDINNALNSLQKDEEQIKQEIEKLQGKYEFENGKFVEPKEVTQYKKDLERVQKEIEEKTATREQRKLDEEKLTERENNLIEEKANLEDENRIKYLKNLYRNNPEAYEMIDKKLEERRRRIDFKLSEIEKIRNLPESERANIDIDEWLKEAEEKNLDENYEKKTEPREEEIGEKTLEVDEPIEPEEEAESPEENEEQIEPEEEAESPEENEEPIEPEEEAEIQEENEEETKQMLAENIDREIEKINQLLKKYEELENEIKELSEPFDVDMEQKINSQKKEFKDLKLSIGKLSIKKQTLEAMKELVEKDVKQAKKEYEEYENKSEENDKEIEQIEETIEKLDVKQKEIADEYKKKEEERFTNSIDDIIAEFEDILDGYEYINDKVSEVRENVGFIGFFGKETDKEVIKKVFEEADAEVTKKIKSINKLKNKLISIKKLAETDLNAAWNEMSNEEEELDSIETESVKEQIIELGQLCDEIKKYKEYIQTETEAHQQFNFEKSEEINKIADLIKNSTDMDIGKINDLRLRIGKIRIELVRGNDIRDNKENWCELAKDKTNLTDFLEEIKQNMKKYMEEYKKEREKEISELKEAFKEAYRIEPEEFEDGYYFDDEEEPEGVDEFEEYTENPYGRSEEAQFEPNEEEESYENYEPDEEELGENDDDSEEHKDTQRKISKAKKISRTLGKIGRGISRFKETGVFRFVYNILDKLANKIVPLEISEGEERRNDENSLEEQLKAGDEEYNKRSSGESEKVVNINRSREYRRKQRVSREQLNPIEHKNKDSKDKENQKDNEGPDKD
ncbi:MAG: hypothetical protein ACLR4X_00410 [Clostridia bacterium]